MPSDKLLIFAGPSGSGKTTIVHHLLKKFPVLEFSVSATTRTKRENETDGVDYYFISTEEFKKKIQNNEFIEWEQVYENIFYGTLKSEVERIWKKNKGVIFDVDVKGALSIKKIYGIKSLSVFVMVPSIEELKMRLKIRATESTKSFKRRIDKAESELAFVKKFDKVIVNDKKGKAFQEAETIVTNFLQC